MMARNGRHQFTPGVTIGSKARWQGIIGPQPRLRQLPMARLLLPRQALNHGAETTADLSEVVQRDEQRQGLPKRRRMVRLRQKMLGDRSHIQHVINGRMLPSGCIGTLSGPVRQIGPHEATLQRVGNVPLCTIQEKLDTDDLAVQGQRLAVERTAHLFADINSYPIRSR